MGDDGKEAIGLRLRAGSGGNDKKGLSAYSVDVAEFGYSRTKLRSHPCGIDCSKFVQPDFPSINSKLLSIVY
jgi:hypothetical protein